ncbi:glycine betaine/choline ABC transporter membrane protein [Klebsiella pneumoniae]|uniref:Glycine betaine/choline ABC transporter membrane protein n=1 Tax=Klebsiella pneumoniae TaxID=573 RepID=A0A4P0YAY9_KLEPN|nr:glycine betaine/choline ABC transporter membrane protein [Klebsiella pneumoniae]
MTIKAAAQQTSGVNAAMAYGTDGPVAALGLQTLSDPQGVQPIYAPTPVVREAVLKAYPQIADWLQPVFASLDEKNAAAAERPHCGGGPGCEARGGRLSAAERPAEVIHR